MKIICNIKNHLKKQWGRILFIGNALVLISPIFPLPAKHCNGKIGNQPEKLTVMNQDCQKSATNLSSRSFTVVTGRGDRLSRTSNNGYSIDLARREDDSYSSSAKKLSQNELQDINFSECVEIISENSNPLDQSRLLAQNSMSMPIVKNIDSTDVDIVTGSSFLPGAEGFIPSPL